MFSEIVKKLKVATLSHAFQCLAAITTAGSILGTYNGIAPLFTTPLAVLCSVALGIITFFSVNYAWNHTGAAKRFAAATVATIFIGVSIWTIYLGALAKHDATQLALVNANQQIALAQQASIDTKDATLRNDINNQLKRLAAADRADRADADQLRADVRSQINELQQLNNTDRQQIKSYQALIKRHHRPKSNAANVRVSQNKISQRIKQISKLNFEIKAITKDLNDTLLAREMNANKLTATLSAPSPIATGAVEKNNREHAENTAINYLWIHAAITDVSSVLLLFLAWLYQVKPSVKTIDTPILSDAVNEPTVDTDPTVEQKLPDSQAIIETTEVSEDIQPSYLSKTETLEQLKHHQIAANTHGRITITLIRAVTGWGYSKAKGFLENDCVKGGVLDAHSNGSGLFFTYPQVKSNPLTMISGGKA